MARANGWQDADRTWNMEPKMEALFSRTFRRTASEGVRHLEGETEIWKTMIIRDDADYDDDETDDETEEQSRTMIITDDDYDDDNHHVEHTIGCNDEKKTTTENDEIEGSQSQRGKTSLGRHRTGEVRRSESLEVNDESRDDNSPSCSHRRFMEQVTQQINLQRYDYMKNRQSCSKSRNTEDMNRDTEDLNRVTEDMNRVIEDLNRVTEDLNRVTDESSQSTLNSVHTRETDDMNHLLDDPSRSTPDSVHTCNICFAEDVLLTRFCCQFSLCHSCFDKYLRTQIDEGKVRINCPNYECHSDVPYDEIYRTIDPDTRMMLERFAASALRQKGVKACPQCNAITVASETLLSRAKQEKSRFKVTCPVCELEWCYDCEMPWHHKSTCDKTKSSDKLFKEWTKRYSGSQKNARRCPKCRVYIQKESGCDSMTCQLCGTRFCYKCGRRFGQSTHRCLGFPRKPDDSKGSVLLYVLLAPLAIPAIVIVAAFSLPFLIGYGGYKVVKAVRKRPTTMRNH